MEFLMVQPVLPLRPAQHPSDVCGWTVPAPSWAHPAQKHTKVLGAATSTHKIWRFAIPSSPRMYWERF